jgi:ABC-type multidrug transport system fused ATPase/permease subunit
MQFSMYSCILLISWMGAKMIIAGNLTEGQLMSMFTYVINILISLMMVSMTFVMLIMSRASGERISEVLAEEPDLYNVPHAIKEVADGSVDFEQVGFAYPSNPGKEIISDLNIHIRPGETIGVLGGTGSAKSSFAALIPRLYDVTRGEVRVGGVPVKDYDMASLRDNVSQGMLKTVRDDLFRHMERLPIRYFDTKSHGDIMSIYTNDTDTLRQVISQSIPQMLSAVITIVGVFFSMLVLSRPLTLITVVMVICMVFATKTISSKSGYYFVKQQTDVGNLNGYIEEMMEGQKVVKVFCHEDACIQDFRYLNGKLRDSANNANRYASILMPVLGNLGYVSYAVIAMVGACLSIFGGHMTLGTLASFLQFSRSFNQPISQFSQQLNSIIMAIAGAERIFGLLDEEPEKDNGYVKLVNARY